jgi:hypothetical protein
MPQWAGPLILAVIGAIVGSASGWALGMTSSVGSKLDTQTVQLATLKTTIESLCKQLEKQPAIDRAQDERIRQLELQVRTLGHR